MPCGEYRAHDGRPSRYLQFKTSSLAHDHACSLHFGLLTQKLLTQRLLGLHLHTRAKTGSNIPIVAAIDSDGVVVEVVDVVGSESQTEFLPQCNNY